jgi:hypothetical protein
MLEKVLDRAVAAVRPIGLLQFLAENTRQVGRALRQVGVCFFKNGQRIPGNLQRPGFSIQGQHGVEHHALRGETRASGEIDEFAEHIPSQGCPRCDRETLDRRHFSTELRDFTLPNGSTTLRTKMRCVFLA